MFPLKNYRNTQPCHTKSIPISDTTRHHPTSTPSNIVKATTLKLRCSHYQGHYSHHDCVLKLQKAPGTQKRRFNFDIKHGFQRYFCRIWKDLHLAEHGYLKNDKHIKQGSLYHQPKQCTIIQKSLKITIHLHQV